ncbi:hypothetical protein HDU83_001693 [Entophlyctis luteolus]|nr:hypothetical protein HDU83_001693 [Entophlyctis luteolus]
MLKARVLVDILAQPNSGGVETTLLLSPDGSVIGYAGTGCSEETARKYAAVASNVWVAYERHTGEGLAARRGMSDVALGGRGLDAPMRTGSFTQLQNSPAAVVGPAGVPRDEEGLRSVVVQCEVCPNLPNKRFETR